MLNIPSNRPKILGNPTGFPAAFERFDENSDGAICTPELCGVALEKYILSTEQIQNVHMEKYVIMPNHLHLLFSVEAKDGTPQREDSAPSPTEAKTRQNALIPHIVSTFKRFCNREIGKDVFQRSYHDHVIRNKNDFEKIWSYIDDNPRRWNDDCFYCNS